MPLGLIYGINPDFRSNLIGAREALVSSNPEKARHVSISLRSLLESILLNTATNDRVIKWLQKHERNSSKRKIYFRGKKLNRLSRLRYLTLSNQHNTRSGNSENLIFEYTSLIRRLNKLVHTTKSAADFQELNSLMHRSEHMFFFLIRASRFAGSPNPNLN